MSLNIPSKILSLNGQKINQIQFNDEDSSVHIRCSRDKRWATVDPVTDQHGRINRLVKRKIRDTPLILEKSVESRKSAQAPGPYSYMKKVFITSRSRASRR